MNRYTVVESDWRLCFDTTGYTLLLWIFVRGYTPVSVCVDGKVKFKDAELRTTGDNLSALKLNDARPGYSLCRE